MRNLSKFKNCLWAYDIHILEIPTKNYVVTIRDELTKFTQAYHNEDTIVKTVVNNLILYFQHFETHRRIQGNSCKEVDNNLMIKLGRLYDIKWTLLIVAFSIKRFSITISCNRPRNDQTSQIRESPWTPFGNFTLCCIFLLNTKNNFALQQKLYPLSMIFEEDTP